MTRPTAPSIARHTRLSVIGNGERAQDDQFGYNESRIGALNPKAEQGDTPMPELQQKASPAFSCDSR